MKTLILSLDDEDYAAVQEAVAKRQRWFRHPDGGNLLPEGTESDTAGAYLAEICRGWVDMMEAAGEDS